MNLCLVLFQAILFGILVAQYQFVHEVEAEKQAEFSVGNWFSSIEKKINVQFPYDEIGYDDNTSDFSNDDNGMMKDVFQNIRKKAEEIAQIPRRLTHQYTSTDNLSKTQDNKFIDLATYQELAKFHAVANDASDNTFEKNDTEVENPTPTPKPAIKKKKRVKKHKKKNKIHREKKKVQREKASDMSVEKEKDTPVIKKKKVRKERKKMSSKRKFEKMPLKDVNASESDENVQRGKPVDIIVHIKMNE